MGRNLIFTLLLVVKSVCANLRYFSRDLFCRDLCAFVWKKLSRKLYSWRKMTNMKYGLEKHADEVPEGNLEEALLCFALHGVLIVIVKRRSCIIR